MKLASRIGSLTINAVLFVLIVFLSMNAFFGWWNPLGTVIASGANAFSDFTLDAAMLYAVSALLTVIYESICLSSRAKEIPHYVRTFKLITVASLMVSFFFSLIYLYPMTADGLSALFNPVDTLWIRFLIPLIALVSFLVFEHETKLNLLESLFSIIPSLCYFVAIWLLIYRGVIGDPYPILNTDSPNTLMPIIYGLTITLGVFIIALIIIPVRNAIDSLWCRSITIASAESTQLNAALKRASEKAAEMNNETLVRPEVATPEETEDKEINNDEEPAISYAPEDSEEEEETIEREKLQSQIRKGNYKGVVRVYHISKQKNGVRWQVRLATSKRAIKLFNTQKEAISYAKELVKKNGGSIRIHSLKGKMRKE